MDSLYEISSKIEQLRASMNELISKDPTLSDPKILTFSQELDIKISEYNELLKNKG
jgi:hypothetical protein